MFAGLAHSPLLYIHSAHDHVQSEKILQMCVESEKKPEKLDSMHSVGADGHLRKFSNESLTIDNNYITTVMQTLSSTKCCSYF